jgi:hypothetical protein
MQEKLEKVIEHCLSSGKHEKYFSGLKKWVSKLQRKRRRKECWFECVFLRINVFQIDAESKKNFWMNSHQLVQKYIKLPTVLHLKTSSALKGRMHARHVRPRTTDTQWRHKSKIFEKLDAMWQIKYASDVPKTLGLNLRPCSEGYFLSGRP